MTEPYRYGGARALVELHEARLRSFAAVWREAKAKGLVLAPTDDPDYLSLDHLLYHVMSSAIGYLSWCCEVLDAGAPDLPEAPPPEAVDEELDDLLERVLDGWRASPLRNVAQKAFYFPAHESRWKVPYCVDSMLEHAVMHPIRHEHQLRTLMAADQEP